jgi:toxin FitB
MNVVDSSGWLEYFTEGVNSTFFENVIEKKSELLVPTISIYEVFKKIVIERTENDALLAIETMLQGKVVELDSNLSISAARISLKLQIPMADSIMLATARIYNAILWTQDSHFEKIDDVQYKAKNKVFE